jgi:hypothetical protein
MTRYRTRNLYRLHVLRFDGGEVGVEELPFIVASKQCDVT